MNPDFLIRIQDGEVFVKKPNGYYVNKVLSEQFPNHYHHAWSYERLMETGEFMKPVEETIRNIISEQLGIDANSFELSATTESLGSDSLDEVELMMMIEEAFSISISDKDVKKLKTVQQLIDHVISQERLKDMGKQDESGNKALYVKRVKRPMIGTLPKPNKPVAAQEPVNPRIDLDEAYMQMAEIWAQRSYATRSKVGALMIKDRQIISDGYNGMPTGFANSEVEFINGEGKLETSPLVLHAESNAILKCAKSGGVSSEGSTLYVTMTPCLQCCKLIIQSGIKKVFYRDAYRDMSSLAVLERAGIPVVQLPKKG